MALDLTQFSTDLANAISDLPSTFTWDSNNYQGIATVLTEAENYEIEGTYDDVQLSIYALTSVFGSALPEASQTIIYDSKTYRILRVSQCPTGAGIEIHCEEETA